MPTSALAPDPLDQVEGYAVEVGQDLRLVQGAGGNFSVKTGDVLWIKASGTRLSQAAAQQIFVPMRLADTRAAVLETEDLSSLVIDDETARGLRPSIETALHALLPHRVVLHVHSTGAIAAGLGEDPLADVALPDWFHTVVVPYAKPGVHLARVVLAEIGDSATTAPLALLLQNHGLVAAAEDVSTAARIVESVQQAFAPRPAPSDAGPSREADGWTLLHPAGTLTEDEAAMLRLGAFTPDEAVFLGPRPFTSRETPDPSSLVAVDVDGAVWLREGIGADETEIASSLVDVARLAPDTAARPLDHEQVSELTNWEAEKWRRQLKR